MNSRLRGMNPYKEKLGSFMLMDRSKACRVIDSLPPLHIRVIGLESRLWPDADAFSNQMQYDTL